MKISNIIILPNMNISAIINGTKCIVKPTDEIYDILLHDSTAVVAPDYVDVEPTLEELKARKLTEINGEFEASISVTKVGVPVDEIATWDIQKLEAEAWEANGRSEDTYTPFMRGLLGARNVERAKFGLEPYTYTQLMEKTLFKVKLYEDLVKNMTGKRQGLEDAIENATTKEAVENIVWEVVVPNNNSGLVL